MNHHHSYKADSLSASPISSVAEILPSTNTNSSFSIKAYDRDQRLQPSEPTSRTPSDSLEWPLPCPSVSSSTLTYSSTLAPLFKKPVSIRTIDENEYGTTIEMLDMRLNVICNWLHQQQLSRMWSIGEEGEGVLVRKSKGQYVCCPRELVLQEDGLHKAIQLLNVKCAITVNTKTIKLMLQQSNTPFVPLSKGLRLQVMSEIKDLPQCQKNHFAAFIRDPAILVVWDEDPSHLLDRVRDLEGQMLASIWDHPASRMEEVPSPTSAVSTTNHAFGAIDLEAATLPLRKTALIQPCIVAATLMLMFLALGAGWRGSAIEIKILKRWVYLVFPAIGPLQAWMGLFFMQTVATCAAEILGPVSQMRQNSKFYSGVSPPKLSNVVLPHVTVQCPVYKESLETVIKPTIKSIKAAITTYEMQGGTANIFINDDGMQVIDCEQAQERRDFYEENSIGWVARPRHNTKPAGGEKAFVRAGKFKKASNMNHALNMSLRIEAQLQSITRSDQWTHAREQTAYHRALAGVIAEEGGLTWGAGDIRVGDYILLVDSDTRVPSDCLLDAVSEMEQSPEVAIIQFSSGVMNVTESWFEKGITFFTHLVYTAIEFAVANGDVAPFVGHNAILRWTALQDVARTKQDDPSYQMFWSENTVSEDFDIALRLQTSGYIVRLATYATGGFKEGVSLTVYDELARWEKYAYGCSELIFHPLVQWLYKGPFTSLFYQFVFSSMPFHSKITILAYVGTYFAIGSAWLLILLNYFLVGWYNGYLDHYYVDSFKIYFSMIVIFGGVGHVALAVLRYRIHEKKLIPSLFENFKWVPLLTAFLGGISLHVSQAILCHLFSVDMSWGATSKEANTTSFFKEVPIILRKFRITFLFCLFLTVVMVVLSGVGPFGDLVPYFWQIRSFTAIFPLSVLVASHALLPLVLNPGLMQFTF